MKDLENLKTAKQTKTLDQNETVLVGMQESFINESPALATLEAKLMRRRKKATPLTYRRPTYLQYIDYA